MPPPSPASASLAFRVLTLNAGSSSLKFAVYSGDTATHRGRIDGIGSPAPTWVSSAGDRPSGQTPVAAHDIAAAAEHVFSWLRREDLARDLAAIGHRIVQGGPRFRTPTRLTAAVLDELRRLAPFDPTHLPAELQLIEACARRFPSLPQIGCFDTGFHAGLPAVARLLPIPRRYAAQGVQRYGFHGLSYTFLLRELERIAGAPAARGRVILAHLGNGASLAAARDGQSVDTTMAFTSAAGIPMSTRSGDLDPGLVGYLARTEAMTPERFHQLVNRESGLLGISGTSGDIRELLAREADGDSPAAEAIALFCYHVKKTIGAFTAALGGLDTLVFSGGVGEHAAPIRARICDGLACLGLALDAPANAHAEDAALISARESRVAVHVIPTDEECILAEGVRALLAGQPTAAS